MKLGFFSSASQSTSPHKSCLVLPRRPGLYTVEKKVLTSNGTSNLATFEVPTTSH